MAAMTDDELIDAVRRLVEAGEHLDEIPGIPQATTESGGMFLRNPDGSHSRVYERATEEFRAAKASGVVAPLPPPPPTATPVAVAEAEAAVGHPLPPVLCRLYLEVANGGFGPGYGILGLRGGHGVEPEGNAIERHRWWQDHGALLPATLLPVCDWGCAITSFVDCADGGRMWALDPNPVDDVIDGLFPQELRFTEWMALWLDGSLHQPWAIEDTGAWRGATNEETGRELAGDGD